MPVAQGRTASDMRIAGLSRFSAVDWPGRLVATVFLQGCPWDCGYCHNPDLIDPRGRGGMPWEEVVAFLGERRGLLDGVVFSGGEPTMQRALGDAIAQTCALGFEVGLHTGGAYPVLLEGVLPSLSWIGLDVKAGADDYAAVTGRGPSGRAALRSLDLVIAAQRERAASRHPLDVEVRTTVHPDLIDDARLGELGALLADRGVRRWAIQRFRATGSRCGVPVSPPLRLDRVPRERFDRVEVR
ncbi:anaerobic ribonucleoside-triphosphate reductase activating protein [Microbacterium sp. 2P01SA-2]|uniref:anaerobic ribonucleoside-triphosphate reductase activating protein n=1 Tax=unclassified Microbacterium TaxID=2609290 RepID=UPI00399F17AA